MLGGTIVGTAVAWAVSTATASADQVQVDDLGQRAASILEVGRDVGGDVAGTVREVTDALPAAEKAVDAVRSAKTLRVPAAQRPASLGLLSTDAVVPGKSEQDAVSWVSQARTIDVGEEVAAADDGPAPDGAVRVRSPRTTSGTDGPQGGTGDAPAAYDPASVPPVLSPPVAAASGCPAGSSLFPALIGLHAPGDVVAGGQALLVRTSECGRPDTTGAQPGTSPD